MRLRLDWVGQEQRYVFPSHCSIDVYLHAAGVPNFQERKVTPYGTRSRRYRRSRQTEETRRTRKGHDDISRVMMARLKHMNTKRLAICIAIHRPDKRTLPSKKT
jgi:hypothetical protein